MAKLDIWKIEVVKEQSGEWGGDELYFTVDGKKATLTTPSLHTGDTYVFPYKPIYFSGTANVNLYEDDGPDWLNPDDHVDAEMISSTPGTNILKYMDGAGGLYDVYFNVYA